ncbi:PREDICTED: TOM1-like protein 2 [Ipomoea nil]|uniref:TOM1-like protein 2 n=1 Tax=Ipomoea nil TaxID=35883 RepID=UPI000901ED23|nr:PREDICTED: TOM1-like protein 2 [Ipomoea nil]XP_019149691.1 PREDICTED: TOM1-like protein 2 [Ipomoea nil]XP_019149692.1 PREDICTED: TOM1-like protein 2 [Ipomoea nil]XP_019149693.1 PREDICTED: TOM1-like protein 2 [Ipomoea nil]
MSDNLMDKVSSLGERLKIGGSEVGQKITAGMSSMSFKMKEFFQGPNQADKLVEEATAETLDEPNWATNLELCDMINHDRVNSVELIRGIKKRIQLKSPRIQYLALALLETIAKNCEKAFSEIAAERVLDEMVKLIDDPQTVVNNRNKALMMIESWGESSNELRYLPVYEETYKSLRSRGVRFPGRDNESLAPIFTPPRSVAASELNATLAQQMHNDVPPPPTLSAEQTKEAFDVARNSVELLTTVLSSSPQQDALEDDLTTTLVQQCRQSQNTVQRIIETAGDNEALLFEALNVNDEILKALSKYEEIIKPAVVPSAPEPAMIPVAVEPDESSYVGKEDSLIRKPAGSRPGAHNGPNDEMMDDLDEMIFGKKAGGSSESGHDQKKQQPPKDDLISF